MKKHICWLSVLAMTISIMTAFSSSVYAANWKSILTAKDGAEYYLDVDSLEKNEDHLRFWQVKVYTDSSTNDGEKKVYTYYEVFLPETRKARVLKITSYDDNNNVVHSYAGPFKWTEVTPRGILDAMTNAALHYLNSSLR